MTQPGGAPEGYTPRAYESEIYARAAGANKASIWDPDWRDPAEVAGAYSNKSAEVYERKLAVGGGGYREGLNASDVDYRGMPHERLQTMVRDGASAQEVDEQGIVVNDLGNLLKELSTTVQQAVSKEQAGWQGKGAEAVFRGFHGLSKWMDTSGDAAFLTANRYSQTSAAISNAQNGMPEPAGRTVMQSMDLAHQQLSGGDFLGAMKTYKDMPTQANTAFQARQQAAEVLLARDQTLYDTGSTQPMYSPPPQPVTLTEAQASSLSGSFGVSGNAVPDVGRTTASSSFVPSASAGSGALTPPVIDGGAPPVGLNRGVTTGSDPVRGSIPPSGGEVGGWSRTPGSTLNPGLGAGLLAPVGGTGGDVERGGSGRSGSGTGGRAGGRVPGSGGAEQEPGAGKKSGTAQPGAKAAAAEAERIGAAGKAGKAGAGGMPGAAGGGKKSEEDKEHKRSVVMVEHDPEAALDLKVSTDEHGNKISPPVIGE